ncbi:hypothetical protein A2714_02595 [Candidatus Woesebacteria bacterium RIFCSPHIGHO2_01_FULL_38_9]|uniref:Uncharacterized protein n=2 Tax=Candidatus Woeseibacteriota TaxID=1752722 RepID=A0A1F7XYD5_9BACT|nr:MAG: hypothetical protein A2714_02595 [Candidatus Woesebacteria bacterium RIFCSPHIGHO2_01_FULL_38_9]OGM59635.1 MAG: hypothetical protein A3A75_06130 [Candidatus Woesebacteria bacterium RIFCSPLOWO2_01_FULL_39_10]
MYLAILSKVKTREEKEKVQEELQLLLSSLYEDEGRAFDSTLNHKVRAWVSQALTEEISKEAIGRESYLKGLIDSLEKLNEIYLNCAFEPTQDFVDRLGMYLDQAVGSHVLMNISKDPEIIGGVQIIFKGQYLDFSFKRIFEKEFEESREEYLKLLKGKQSQ